MSDFTFEAGGSRWRLADTPPCDLAIPLRFDGPQPRFFGAPRARAEVLEAEGFTGDTRRGGSCNVEYYHLIPHCNGTHTESLGHIVDEPVPVGACARGLLRAGLISVAPLPADAAGDSRLPESRPADHLISRAVLAPALELLPPGFEEALVLRTLPNAADKRTREYRFENPPPYFTPEAMELLVARGVHHLLVDLPSLDRMDDGGRLTAHRVFWGLPAGSRRAARARRPEATVTEMIYVPDAVADGPYLLSLQLPAFMSDAAPSRPLLYPLERA